MNYQKEYASLLGQIDRAVSLLEEDGPGSPAVQKARDLLLHAILSAEERYIESRDTFS